MQKFSACRNCGSGTHFFSSMTMRCINAIWPAGPPKDRQPILNQVLKASPKLGAAAVSTVVVVMISRSLYRPIMPFLGGKAQPGEQGIIDHEAALQQAMIVIAGKLRQAERNGVQSSGFRCDVGPRGVGAAHD